jgi:hypothetical protein
MLYINWTFLLIAKPSWNHNAYRAFGQRKSVCVYGRKTWQLWKKYFYGFGQQKAVLTRDKILTTICAHEQKNLSRETGWPYTRESKLVKGNLLTVNTRKLTCQGKLVDRTHERVNLSRETCWPYTRESKLVKGNLLTVHTRELTCQGKLVDHTHERVNLSRETCWLYTRES